MALNGWSLSIYGSDTNYSPTSKFILKSTLDGNISPSGSADVVKSDIEIAWVRPEIEPEGSIITFATRRQEGFNKNRITYDIEIKAKAFPTTATTIESFYFTQALGKRYKWLWLNDFELRPSNSGSPVANTSCIQVAFTGFSVAHSAGYKITTYSFSEADTI